MPGKNRQKRKEIEQMKYVRFMKMDEKDNVASALEDTKRGDVALIFDQDSQETARILVMEPVPYGNKIALFPIGEGEDIMKYGQNVGCCTRRIREGGLVHIHNVKSRSAELAPSFQKEVMRRMKLTEKEEADT